MQVIFKLDLGEQGIYRCTEIKMKKIAVKNYGKMLENDCYYLQYNCLFFTSLSNGSVDLSIEEKAQVLNLLPKVRTV